MLDKQGYMHAGACTSPRARAHARAHTHTQICNIYCFSTATIIRARASMLRYTYIVCLVCFEGIHPVVFDTATVYIHLFYSRSHYVHRYLVYSIQHDMTTATK